ncbi:MAG TPA: glucose-6-phosphate dehydrogenase (coenzyme-F420) [Gaiellaceae bacterium]|nr:glucose-6-phosphate dehydrogenase (coenzyme-F420) [Gaiellaceae bacterium]
MLRLGYKASAEQFPPRRLLDFAVDAERQGLEIVAISDHFQPFRHTGGHGTAALPWLGSVGERTERALLGTSVLTPTLRYHPSMIAHAFGTLALLNPGRVFLGVGTGESLNETPATGADWPGAKERRLRLAEAIDLMRRLWTDERVSFEGEYYRTRNATIYDRPDEPVPVYVAASGPLAAKLAGRVGDGFIVTSGKDPALYEELNGAMEEGARDAGRDPGQIVRMIEIKVSYDHDLEFARHACDYWAPLALSPEQKRDVEDPIELERLADADPGIAQRRFIVSDDPDEVVEKIRPYVELGFDQLVFHAPGDDQQRFLDQFCADVVPRLRARFG